MKDYFINDKRIDLKEHIYKDMTSEQIELFSYLVQLDISIETAKKLAKNVKKNR